MRRSITIAAVVGAGTVAALAFSFPSIATAIDGSSPNVAPAFAPGSSAPPAMAAPRGVPDSMGVAPADPNLQMEQQLEAQDQARYAPSTTDSSKTGTIISKDPLTIRLSSATTYTTHDIQVWKKLDGSPRGAAIIVTLHDALTKAGVGLPVAQVNSDGSLTVSTSALDLSQVKEFKVLVDYDSSRVVDVSPLDTNGGTWSSQTATTPAEGTGL